MTSATSIPSDKPAGQGKRDTDGEEQEIVVASGLQVGERHLETESGPGHFSNREKDNRAQRNQHDPAQHVEPRNFGMRAHVDVPKQRAHAADHRVSQGRQNRDVSRAQAFAAGARQQEQPRDQAAQQRQFGGGDEGKDPAGNRVDQVRRQRRRPCHRCDLSLGKAFFEPRPRIGKARNQIH